MRAKLLFAIAGLSVLPLASACSSPDASPAANAAAPLAQHPVSGLAIIPLSVTSSGKPHSFRVELAKSDAEQEKGLMFRTIMGADEGMLFPYPNHRQVAFWMRNTVMPLDIIFIGTDRRILNIADAKPYDETPLPSAGPVSAVLELNAGRAAQLGIKPGDRVSW